MEKINNTNMKISKCIGFAYYWKNLKITWAFTRE